MEIITLVQSITQAYEIIFNSDADDEDSEDEFAIHAVIMRQRRTKRKRPSRIKYFVERTIAGCSEKEFQSHFRVSRNAFDWILHKIGPQLVSKRICARQTVDPEKQLLAVIWLLATPDSYRSVGCRFDLAKSTLSAAFFRVIAALNSITPDIITWPDSHRRDIIERNFFRMARVPGVIGAVDGSYVPIKAPQENPQVYINRKCFYAITLQAICDHELRFTDCFTGYPSSVSDVRIFRNSDIFKSIVRDRSLYFDEDQFILGDKAYPCYKWCIPPYIDRGYMLDRQRNFNHCHAKTRQVIERSFALLFGRFRRLRYLDMNRNELIPSTIIAACTLHNICLKNEEHTTIVNYVNEGQEFLRNTQDPAPANETEGILNDRIEASGNELRNIIAENLYDDYEAEI